MVTDITIDDSSGDKPKTFEVFARDDMPLLARAIAVVANDEPQSTAAVAAGAEAVHDQWAVNDTPEREFYATAVRHLITQREIVQQHAEDESSSEGSTLRAATIVAFYGLDWPVSDIAFTLDIPPEQVMSIVEQAAANHPEHFDDDLRTHIKRQMATVQSRLPDIAALRTQREAKRRRNRLLLGGVGALGFVLALALFGQFGSRDERAELVVEPTTAPAPTATPRSAPDTSRPTPPSSDANEEALGQETFEPADSVVTALPPDLIVDDGQGGFAGVRAGGDEGTAVVIVTSPHGTDWSAIGGLNFGPSVSVGRFDRAGDRFVVWLDGLATANDTVIETIAVTSDFRQWNFIQLAIDAPAPRGLLYEFEVTDIAFRDNTILALVAMTVELDFPALQLVESNTCGHSIETEVVIVKLCNGGEIDVLSVAGIEQLPLPTRLFAGTDGFGLRETRTQFLRDATAFVSTADVAVLTDESGRWLASSTDGQIWQRPTVVLPPGVITAAATNNSGDVVSVIRDGELVLHTSRGSESFSQPLLELVPDLAEADALDVTIGESDGLWVVYVAADREARIISSVDGETWETREVASMGVGAPMLFVGAEDVIAQWRQSATTTLVVELD